MSMRGFLHFRDALELPLLLLAGGFMQSLLDDVGYGADVNLARGAGQTPQQGRGGDLCLLPEFSHGQYPSKPDLASRQ